MLPWFEGLLVSFAVALALLLRPWRALPHGGPHWPWLVWWLLLPAF